nr:copia protein [Tanacetum cinerariifolium]
MLETYGISSLALFGGSEDGYGSLPTDFGAIVFRNKKYERGIVIRNKARLVAQGFTQEEGIDYDELFSPVAKIKAIRLFFAYASFMGFHVYQMNVKSAFLYERIKEEIYVCRPPGFEDPDYPDKVYKAEASVIISISSLIGGVADVVVEIKGTDIMADMNIPTNNAPAEQAHAIAPPTRTDDQIFPSSNWVPIGKSNCVLDERIDNVGQCSISTMESYLVHDQHVPYRNNLSTSSHEKKKTTHLLIPSIRFTKLIIHHLKTKHNIHPRSGLPPHYSHDESVRNTLRYVRKDGREIFSMPIPDALLTDEIKGAAEGGATESSKSTKGRLVRKIHKPMSSLKLVDEPSAEDVSVEEPAYNEKKSNLQRDLELSLKEQAEQTQGPDRQVVIREPESRRIQLLSEVQGKRKEKVVEKQATHDLLTLHILKNKSPVDQFIFQRHTPMPVKAFGPAESPSLDAELDLTDSKTKSDDEVPKINTGDQDEGQTGPNPGHGCFTSSNPEQLDEEFTITAYSNVQENLKLPSEDLVIPEEPTSFTRTMSSLQNLEIELSFTDQFFVEKQQEEEPGKTNAEAEVQSMVLVLIQQDTSRDMPTVDMKEILQQWMFEDKSYEAHKDHKKLYDALEKSLECDYSDQLLSDLEEARQKKRRDVPRTPSGSPPPQPPPPPPPTGASGAPAGLSGSQELSPTDSLIPDDSIPDEQVHLSDDEDSENDHLPKADLRKGWWKPLSTEERPTTSEPTWTIPSSNVSDVENNWATALALTYVTPAKNSLLAKTEDMMNFLNWYCRQVNKTKLRQVDLEGLTGRIQKEIKSESMSTDHCLSVVLQMKATSYPDFGLELLVPKQIWIEYVCTYDISAKSQITHADSQCRQNKAYLRYRYDYLSEIVLGRADLQEHTIAKKDFKNLHPSNFEDPNLLLLEGHLDHLPSSDKNMLSTAVKLWTRNLVIRQRVKTFNLSQGIQDQAAQSEYEYALLDLKGRDKEQRVHSGY